MFHFEHFSLSKKLTLISVWSTGSALTLVLLAYAATSVVSHSGDQRQQLSSLAGVIGTNSVTALLFADPRQAGQTLAALNVKDDIVQAALFDRDGRRFARYTAPGAAAGPVSDLSALRMAAIGAAVLTERCGPFWAPGMRLYRPVRSNGELVGVVMIEAGLATMWRDVLETLGASALASALSLLVALYLAGRFKGAIAAPIDQLIAAARLVSTSQSYQLRVPHQRSDELGSLIDSFNDMLSQIDGRDAKLAQYRDQLERQVGVRTEQLEKAKNAAEAASHAKSAFLATMSHEIRTPMNGVLGMTELLLATPLTEQQRHYTDMVRRSGQHLLVIINDILDFSKIETGKLTVEYIHFNFRELLDDIDHVFAPQARLKGLTLEFAIANDIPLAICGDPNRLRQVIVNLLGNAIKFTDRGQITVRVDVTAEDAQSVSLRCAVHDSGIGVAREAQARIFDSFSQADGSTTRKHGGTGLGLAISKQLVELMGGTIGVDNALTQGSVFWFTVNFDKRRVDADDPGFNYTITQGLRVVIVDQHTDSRALLQQQLADWKIRTDCADSAADALRLLHAAAAAGQPYDVALLDMAQARTSGLALAADIKADAAIAAIKLLLLSTERDAADGVQRREAGVAFQLIKPPRVCDLYDCIVTPTRAGAGTRPPAARPVHAAHTGHVAHTTHAAHAAETAPAAHAASTGRPISAAQPVQPPSPARTRRRRRKVLLAEDNPVNVEVACAMLEGLGVDVSRADNGEQALQSVRDDDFDLVLMDCQMPVMDGFAATTEIRHHEQRQGRARTLPIIAITANALQGDREACLAAGMDDYLSKPFTQLALGETIGRWITLPRAAAAHQHDDWPLTDSATDNAASPSAAIFAAAGPVAATVAVPPPSLLPPTGLRSGKPERAPATTAHAARPNRPNTARAATPAAAQPGRDIINRRALEHIRALSPRHGDALLDRVLHAYVDDAPGHFQTLRLAIAAGQPDKLRKAAHSLKSSSANVGADALAQLCRDLEQLGRDERTDGAAALLSDMEREFQSVRDSFSAILEKES